MKKQFIFVFMSLVLSFGLLVSCGNPAKPKETTQTDVTPVPAEALPTEAIPANSEANTVATNQAVKVEIQTSLGTMQVKLYDDTPLHRDNFVKLVETKFYDGCLFHRVIKDFMIQTGDPESKKAVPNASYGKGGPGYTIPAELGKHHIHKKGALAAARLGNQQNPERASSGSQFYIVQGQPINKTDLMAIEKKAQVQNPNFKYTAEDIASYANIGGTPFLDSEYTVFGELIAGSDILDKIAASATQQGDRPSVDIKIISMKIIK